ncbi:hypothetical protein PMIN01_05400 [Paraphaeosphaeria minitans]|uniref:Uncharacterized protein n=1 Tax=Paraphaeosphaeria minitans TaxID=565426 RepID=A0A9P6KT64_9PLEO|nr:hypothetical protein PMIN01_05400 [Paraphaeosphaeria minitans]
MPQSQPAIISPAPPAASTHLLIALTLTLTRPSPPAHLQSAREHLLHLQTPLLCDTHAQLPWCVPAPRAPRSRPSTVPRLPKRGSSSPHRTSHTTPAYPH